MKKILIALFILTGVSNAFAQLPGVNIENNQGEIINTSSLVDGTPMIISFWSTTCKACIQELKAVNDLLDEWMEDIDFKVIAVSVDDVRSSSKAKSLAAGQGWDRYILLYDKNQDFKRAMNVNLIPHVFVMDGQGNVIYSHTSYTPGSEWDLYNKIKEL